MAETKSYVRSIFKSSVLFVVMILCTQSSFAGVFFDHKFIGDSAFKQFIRKNNLNSFFADTLHFKRYGDGLPIPFIRHDVKKYYDGMFAFSFNNENYSYGDFSGLAADHTIDFIQLYEGLFNTNEMFSNLSANTLFPKLKDEIHKALAAHYAGIEQGNNEGKYSSASYLLIANEDKSHFQRPPETFEEMLKLIDPALIAVVDSMANTVDTVSTKVKGKNTLRQSFDKKLLELNNASKYALIHTLAMRIIKMAGQDYYKHSERSITNIKIAFIMNAFADHFLQDAFAGGHLPVKRDKNGLDNNGVHDFYNRVGINVQNSFGDKWRTYGDNHYDSITFSHAIAANIVSLQEVWDTFDSARIAYSVRGGKYTTLYETMSRGTVTAAEWPKLIHQQLHAYQLMPIPLNAEFYSDSIQLKHGSKNGSFYETGIASAFSPTNFLNNYEVHATVGIGYNAVKYNAKNKNAHKPFSQKSESVIWFGLSLNYSYFNRESLDEHRAYVGIHLTWLDRLAFDQGTGYAFGQAGQGIFSTTSAGVELKYLSCRMAPSLKYYVELENTKSPVQGIKLSFRFY